MAVMMPILFRLPRVLKKSDHPVLPLSLSSAMAALTSAYSSWTNSSFSSPSPCQRANMWRASSWRSLLQSPESGGAKSVNTSRRGDNVIRQVRYVLRYVSMILGEWRYEVGFVLSCASLILPVSPHNEQITQFVSEYTHQRGDSGMKKMKTKMTMEQMA